jgi:two-component system response regulator HydG
VVRYTLRAILEEEPLRVAEAADGREALERIQEGGVDLVVSDLKMPGMGGMDLLAALAQQPGAPGVIIITAYGSERLAVEAMRTGALDYFAKPFEPDEILRVIRRSLETVRLADENRGLRARLVLAQTMVFESEEMMRVARLVERAAPRNVTVLITGESGTGKELVARALVKASPRTEKPFVTFNCAALPRELAEAELFGHTKGAFTGADRARRGLFREAGGGTILLDEIGELHPQTQASLLRVLQEREVRPIGEDRAVPVDVRVLATTNRNLAEEVSGGAFRADLFYRLNVVEIHVPPLRERRADIVPLAKAFGDRYADRFGMRNVRLSDRVLGRLRDAPWPGNVRQLEHVVESLVALATDAVIDDDPFADGVGGGGAGGASDGDELTLRERVGRFERELLLRELERFGGNQSQTARALGISRVTLIDKMKKHGLK